MKKVKGIGGIFFKSKDATRLNARYSKHLGFRQADNGAILFEWRNADAPEEKNYTAWAPFNDTTKYFEPSHKDYMINFRVEDLEGLLAELKKEGVQL